jgi:signal transduction histidine kinase
VIKDAQDLTSPFYRSVRRLRYILPIAAFFLVVVHQLLAHTWFASAPWPQPFIWQVLLYGTVGPVVVWFALTWFARWVRERDEAEAHLRCLYRISRQAATATEMDALAEIALGMPEQVVRPIAASLILRDHPDGPWLLAGTRGLQGRQEELLTDHLRVAGSDLYCGQCAALAATAQQNCPLQHHVAQGDTQPQASSVICLPLSTERPPLALLNVYLLDDVSLSPGARRVLESMAAVLSVALDHARLRAREFQMLHRMEQATRQQEGLAPTLEHILADIASVHRAQAGQVYLVAPGEEGMVARERGQPALAPIAAWPAGETHSQLLLAARKALLEEDALITADAQHKGHVAAIPLMAEGQIVGVLVLASRYAFTSSQAAFLRVAASLLALIIRNSQLYARLESQAVWEERNRLAREVHDGLAQSLGFLNFKLQQVDRLLAREQWEAARQAMHEMHQGIQDLYAEVRLTIEDLRWFPEDGQGLPERLCQYAQAFGQRTGLDVSLAVEGEPHLSPQDELHLFRIVQEALANVHKHAGARHAWVRLRAGAQGILLEIEDDGMGMAAGVAPQATLPADAPGHFGLRIMQERAAAMGGQLSLHSIPGQGTRLQVAVGPAQAPANYPVSSIAEGK